MARKRAPLGKNWSEYSGVTTSIEEVLPEKMREEVEKMLAQKGNPRPMSETYVKVLVETVKRGDWVLSESAIMFDEDGILVNGQHRFEAGARAGEPLIFLIMRNCTLKMVDEADGGRVRSKGQVLQRHGHKNTQRLAAAINIVHKGYENQGLIVGWFTGVPTRSQALRLAVKHKALSDSVMLAGAWTDILNPGPAAAIHYLTTRYYEADTVTEFFEAVGGDGASLRKRSPELLLRNRMTKDKSSRSDRLPAHTVAALYIIALTAHLNGEDMTHQKLTWTPNQPFPRIPGWPEPKPRRPKA